MVGDDVGGQLEPEHRHLVQHLALVRDRRRHHDVIGRDPIGGDHQQVVLPLIDLANLAGGVELQIRYRGHGCDASYPTGGRRLDRDCSGRFGVGGDF